MSGAEFLFFAFSGVAGFAAIAALTRRHPADATRWLGVTFAALGVHALLLSAPWLALLQVAAGIGLAALGRGGGPRVLAPRVATGGWTHRAFAGFGVGLVVFVALSTLARQYVTFGAELDRHPEFTQLESLTTRAFAVWVAPLVGLGLLAVVALLVAGLAREDTGEGGRR